MKAYSVGENWIGFRCPGCGGGHSIPVKPDVAGWEWNQNLDRPTISPSILVNRGKSNPTAHVCHSFVRDGHIEFLSDCSHDLAGKTVELPEIDELGQPK